MSRSFRLAELADRVGGFARGNPDRELVGVAPLDRAGPDELSFLTNPRYREAAMHSRAGAVLLGSGVELAGFDLIEVEEPYLALSRLLELFYPEQRPAPGVAASAIVDPTAIVAQGVTIGNFVSIGPGTRIGEGVIVGDGCVIGKNAQVGDASELKPRVVLYPDTQVGSRCLIHAGVVLGGDGYGFATSEGVHHKVPQLGRVVIEDDVEIGANSTVDRGALGDTRVGKGSKIDNLVMIAHGVRIGEHCLLAGQAGIAGSTTVGDHAVFAGQAGAAGHLKIPPGTVVAAKSAVLADPRSAGMLAGIPAVDHRTWKRAQVAARKLPQLQRQVTELRARLAELEERRES